MVNSRIVFFLIVLSVNIIATNYIYSENPATLMQVESKYVCMITNKLFTDEQIVVDFEGKKYYGCCEMCKDKLESDVASRQAYDPLSGNTVDKATAVIGADSSGNVFYFENENNLATYNKLQ